MGFPNWIAAHHTYGALQPYNKRSKIQFANERLQMRQKMDVYKVGKL